ncbi:tRNA-Thr(GGU) m(6)t(6)A37 methyltransferase TsaA [Desulfacinum infernum DSM 9756]|uniref:tRNA-Thr(GGU) m(6)t(6)A37 methyltransferase TsaA n=1 Tax=Desulfacinum infernum DSM 9756 TaxID=1121391 RepID=A0A1M4ZGX2_9BACT|nr:tRNA (N6-threonylcarbamoyladenosine(37)-N6)-methyltransferase TrmO [Desulfacinum infernum]SHF17290.1 tRNA-Thr(GGU) m(6)t(6)A37 methyltransferase TsaA [Desulfacinum infernum DSM 9756]
MKSDSNEARSAMALVPVGHVRSPLKDFLPAPPAHGHATEEYLTNIRRYNERVRNLESELVIFPELEDILLGIEEFSHVLVLYWAHQVPEERRGVLQVHPMGRKDMPKRGVFATCSPARPNPILLSPVRLVSRSRNVVVVRGLEAVDGSPVLDVKPYVRGYHAIDEAVVPQWMERLRQEMQERNP